MVSGFQVLGEAQSRGDAAAGHSDEHNYRVSFNDGESIGMLLDGDLPTT